MPSEEYPMYHLWLARFSTLFHPRTYCTVFFNYYYYCYRLKHSCHYKVTKQVGETIKLDCHSDFFRTETFSKAI